MICDDVELELSGPEPSEGARAHAQTCARCAQTVEALGLARLPMLSAHEGALLAGLPAETFAAWRAGARPPHPVLRAASLLLAAGLGAVVASSALLVTRSEPAPRVEWVHVAAPEVPTFDVEGANLSDDEVFFEVGWPSPTEGDL